MDTQIWYAIFQTLYGGIVGAFDRLGEVILQIYFFLPPPIYFLFPLLELFIFLSNYAAMNLYILIR